MTPLIAIPAAGASSRMRGRDKLLETIDGTPLLRRQALAALATECPVAVTLPPDAPDRRKTVIDLPLIIEEVPEATEGISASLRHAAERLAQDQALCILLPDVPGVTTSDIQTVLDVFEASQGEKVTRAGQQGTDTPGTPLVLPPEIAARFRTLRNEDSGRHLLNDTHPLIVPFPDDRATRDLDTPEAWAAWRVETNTPD